MVNRYRLSEEFARLAAINSPPLHEHAIARYLVGRLETLGAEVLFDNAAEATGGEVGNLVARFAGQIKSAEPLLFSVHMDTVEPGGQVRPVLRDGVFFSAGDTVLGADDKAGVAELIEALEVLREQQVPHGPLEVVITIAEEIGLVGAKHLDYTLLKSKRGYALDTEGIGWMVLQAPGANHLQIDIEGVASHAGMAPELGLSAIHTAALAISRMRLGRIDHETTANIGRIEGGVARNIVPQSVKVVGEARSHDADKLQEQGISIEVLDPRTLVPLDKQTIIDSVKKTGKLVIMSEEPKTGSAAGEISAVITEEAFDYLDAPPVVIGSRNWITPAFEMEEHFFPQPEWIIDAIHQKIMPLEGHHSIMDFSYEKTIKLNIEGV